MKLLPDEKKMIEASERCHYCNHLAVLHNEHCCQYCIVEGCDCKWHDPEGRYNSKETCTTCHENS